MPRGSRKVVQITTAIAMANEDYTEVLFALCDDGSIWRIYKPVEEWTRWEIVRAVPAKGTSDE